MLSRKKVDTSVTKCVSTSNYISVNNIRLLTFIDSQMDFRIIT